MKNFATFGAAALLFLGAHAAHAQSADFSIRSVATGISIPVTPQNGATNAAAFTAAVTKSEVKMLTIIATVPVDASTARIVMVGPTGMTNSAKAQAGAASVSLGQGWSPIYSPLGIYSFKVKLYNASGQLTSVRQLDIDVN